MASSEYDQQAESPSSVKALLEEITPSVYESLKTAIELGKWDDGSRLSAEQLEHSMQVVILYEMKHMGESERTGAALPKGCKSKLDS
ncbi:MAG: hypothetical protein ACI95C_000464 [Pseudohongiellaceae bacterium]|jgi:uncharacterized protein YeaC (DUF1315 family)